MYGLLGPCMCNSIHHVHSTDTIYYSVLSKIIALSVDSHKLLQFVHFQGVFEVLGQLKSLRSTAFPTKELPRTSMPLNPSPNLHYSLVKYSICMHKE